jgi:hypothetical protein
MDVSEENKFNRRTLIGALVIAAMVIIIMTVLIYPREGGGGDGNGDEREGPWKDLDDFKRSISEVPYFNFYEVNGPDELVEVNDPQKSVYLLIGLETSMNSSELVEIGEYLDDGGHVIVADDGTNAQRLSDYLFGRAGGKVNFTGHRYLVDNLASDPEGDPGYVYNFSFIKADTFPLNEQRYELLLHSPNGMEFDGSGRPLVWTTKQLTVVDMNNNWIMDLEGDKYTPFGDIAIEYDIGSNGGRVTYISTTGFFTDNVFDQSQNEGFIRGYIYSLIPDGGEVIYDPSHQWNRYSPHITVLPGTK